MKKMKKVFAMLLAFAMVMGMSLTTFAADVPSTSDKKEVKVANITETGVTVKAYTIVDDNYTANGFTHYSWASGCEFDANKAVFDENDKLNLTDAELAVLAGKADKLVLADTLEKNADGVYVSKQLNVGVYMILVTGAPDTVFNPMIVSVYYDVNGALQAGTVDATSNWTLKTENAYAKSSKSTVDKNILVNDVKTKGDDVAYNDTISFILDEMTIPSYSSQYGTVEYKVVDTMSAGLTYANNLVVKVGGAVVDTSKYTAKVEGQVLTVSLDSTFIKENALKKVEIRYDAKLNEKAALDELGNTNTVKVQYTNNPTANAVLADTDEITTYHYTFDFQIKKVAFDNQETLLNGAEFTLYKGDEEIRKASTANGVLSFAGLDAGSYTFKETKAPTGYKLDETVHTVDIATNYFADGTLKTYTITVDKDTDDELVIEQYVKDETSKQVTVDNAVPVTITNTKMSALPSTGGIGTAVFTIGGCAIMVVAAYFFLANRKKES